MLYDKRWDKTEVKADPFSLEGLIAWLEEQPAHKTYVYMDSDNCVLAQFQRAHGLRYATPNLFLFWKWRTPRYQLENVAVGKPRTFGAALDRARKVACAIGKGTVG